MPLFPLTRRRLLRQLDTAAIEAAIAAAEAGTSGEIRVSIIGFFRGDLRRVGETAFGRLGMMATRHHNGVLILLAPTRRGVVILGDDAIHARVGDSFWSALAGTLAARFRQRDFTAGLVETIGLIGRELAAHFPPDGAAPIDELPNTVDAGPGKWPSSR